MYRHQLLQSHFYRKPMHFLVIDKDYYEANHLVYHMLSFLDVSLIFPETYSLFKGHP